MNDQIEDFIRANRASLDDKEPSGRNWKVIQQKMFAKTSVWNSVKIWRMAAILLLGVCVYQAIPKFTAEQQNQSVLKEFKDVESFYISQISEKVTMIHDQQGQEAGLNGLTHDFHQLEAMYQVLKEEMKVRPSQKVKDALVLNLLVRIDLLNQQLHKIEKEEKKENDEVNA
jgi:hypothetical protein